uniref:Dendritic cell-specific transmembrane protein-like domain-containing protein n=1 Tax=Melopsittacus undulatus TaxID=13146 RepID=A0A8V5GZG5_MELUD
MGSGRGFSWTGCIRPPSLQVLELLECIPPLLFLLLACAMDHVLVGMLSTIRQHSFVQYSFHSEHHLSIHVTGSSLMAQLLRSTIGALNTSSNTLLETSNLVCLPQSRSMNRQQYLSSCLPLAVLVLLCLAQVYTYRLRRVIAAFFFPKREKHRVLYLYNKLLQQRLDFIQRQCKRLIQRGRQPPGLGTVLVRWCCHRWMRRSCTVCGVRVQAPEPICPIPTCAAPYCRQCWREAHQTCLACTPPEPGLDSDSSSEAEAYSG